MNITTHLDVHTSVSTGVFNMWVRVHHLMVRTVNQRMGYVLRNVKYSHHIHSKGEMKLFNASELVWSLDLQH